MSRYTATYLGDSDPSEQEESDLISALKNVKIIDKIPGTFLVEGKASELVRIAAALTLWRLAPEVVLKVSPPRRLIAKRADKK